MKFSSLIVVKHSDAAAIDAMEKAWPWGTQDTGVRAGVGWSEVGWVVKGLLVSSACGRAACFITIKPLKKKKQGTLC